MLLKNCLYRRLSLTTFFVIYLVVFARAQDGSSAVLAGFHSSCREKLLNMLPDSSVAVFFSAAPKNMSADVDYPYHQDADFYYLTGYREPSAVLILLKLDYTSAVLFVPPRDTASEIWTGRRMGVEGAKKILGMDTVFSLEKIESYNIDNQYIKHVYIKPLNEYNSGSRVAGDLSKSVMRKFQASGIKPDESLLPSLIPVLRAVKSEEETAWMKRAAAITCDAQKELMRTLDTSMYEYQAQAVVEYVFKSEGAEEPAFPSILGSGENSCILHYESNRKKMQGGELLVADIGAGYRGYAADVTRTMPVNGKFSAEQAAVYNIVLHAQEAGINACRPGVPFGFPGKVAMDSLAAGLKRLGIIRENDELRKYIPHGISHYVGLDVHDAGPADTLRPGNVITVEPGIYIPAGSPCDRKWWNTGVRIEDDILITGAGFEVLSAAAPKDIPSVEALMRKPSRIRGR